MAQVFLVVDDEDPQRGRHPAKDTVSGVRVLQLVHGFPPRERAGTEVYAARLADGLRTMGHDVHSVAATIAPGAAMYDVQEEQGLTRVVNNTPYAGVRRGEADRSVRAIVADIAARFRPDVVHVQHLRGLDIAAVPGVPTVWTLHDAWAWCAAGGLLLRDGAPCEGPGPSCGPCASGWVRDGVGVASATAVAGRLAPWIAPQRLHRAWRHLPAAVRAVASRGATPVTAAQVEARLRATRQFADRCTLVAPSAWLADAAERQGFPRPVVVPHGVDTPPVHRSAGPDAPFLFLGTLAPHKGPHLVVQAHRQSGIDRALHLHGPPGPDPRYVAALPGRGALADPFPALASARALVLGSTWPENAPLVVIEARAVGCPVIAPAIGGLPELVEHGVDGLLYAPGDVRELARALQRADATPHFPVRPPPTFREHLLRVESLLLGSEVKR